MTYSQQIEIVTIYSASQTTGARTKRRLLGLLSLAVAAAWLWGAHEKADPWIENKAMLAGIGELGGLLFKKPIDNKTLTNQQRVDQAVEFKANTVESEHRAAVIAVTPYVWDVFAYLAGGWLALAGFFGLLGARVSRRMQRQAAYLMILSAIVSVGSIWGAIRWGGLPPSADLPFYAKVGGIQSSYAWFLLLVTRSLR